MLEFLPAELLHEIALYLPCSSILRLSFTSRRLYATCFDQAVFKRNAVSAIYEDKYHLLPPLDDVMVEDWELETCDSEASNEDSDLEEWWPDFEEEEISKEDDWDYSDWGPTKQQIIIEKQEQRFLKWPGRRIFDGLSANNNARIAFAVEKASSYLNVTLDQQPKDRSNDWREGNFLHWFPHLIALRHPVCLTLKPEHLQMLLWHPDHWDSKRMDSPPRNPSTAEYINVAYCILALLLFRLETIPRSLIHQENHDAAHEPFWSIHPNGIDMSEDIYRELYLRTLKVDGAEQVNYNDRYALLVYILLRVWTNMESHDVPCPLLDRLPLTTKTNKPIPFHTPPEHVPAFMLTKEEFAEYLPGDWVCWCTDGRRFDSWETYPAQNMTLRPRDPKPVDEAWCAAVLDEDSGGEDVYGPFTLTGTVASSGEVLLKRTYAKHVTHPESDIGLFAEFRGYITPFGMVGQWMTINTWRSVNSWRFFGFYWMWRKDWCYPAE